MPNYTMTAEEARQLFSYNPETGDLAWRVRKKGVKVGRPTRPNAKIAYHRVCVEGQIYLAHRVAWLITYGCWPEGNIDHINGNPGDNRIVNLRECTQSQNMRNTSLSSRNTSGKKGVTWAKRERKWVAYIRYGGKKHRIGGFDTLDEAYAAYCRAAIEHHGEFANVG